MTGRQRSSSPRCQRIPAKKKFVEPFRRAAWLDAVVDCVVGFAPQRGHSQFACGSAKLLHFDPRVRFLAITHFLRQSTSFRAFSFSTGCPANNVKVQARSRLLLECPSVLLWREWCPFTGTACEEAHFSLYFNATVSKHNRAGTCFVGRGPKRTEIRLPLDQQRGERAPPPCGGGTTPWAGPSVTRPRAGGLLL